jgi:hypothetical protein
MSVINDMLRDLEQRKAPDRNELDAMSLNESLIETQSSNTKKYLLLLAVLLLVVGGGVSALLFGGYDIKLMPLANSSITAPAFEKKTITNEAVTDTESTNQTRLIPDVSTTTAAEIISPIEEQPIEPEVISKASPEKKTDVVKAQPKQLLSEREVQVSKSEVLESKQSVIEKNQEDAVQKSQPIAKTSITKPVVRRETTISPQKRDQNMAEQARKMFNADESRKAYRLLYEFLANHAVDIESRTVLISYLLQDERIAEAGDVLVTTEIDQSPALRQLKARWYVTRGENNLALHTLRKNLPELDDYPEYYELLAAYYQRFGFSEKAAQTYASLLKYDDESANWWAGLAIALDTSKQYTGAVNAYKQALEMPDLSPELFEYIENRLSLLTVAASR